MKLTVAAAKRIYGSYYRIAAVLRINRSTVGRWKRYVPAKYVHNLVGETKVEK